MRNGIKTIKELFKEYIKNPRTDWMKSYEARCQQLAEYKDKSPSDYDEQLLVDIWKTASNGVAKVSPGFLSKEEFNSLLPDLPKITSKIVNNPSIETLSDVYAWAKKAKKKGQFKTLKWGVIHRVFATANPEKYSTILNQSEVKALATELNNQYDLDIDLGGKHEWGMPMISLMAAIKSQGLEGKDVFMLNTFTWELYLIFVRDKKQQNDSIDKENEVEAEINTCINTIYYGPPGTGKTYKLQQLLKNSYTDNRVIQERRQWLNNEIERIGWHEIIILILLESEEPMKVADIIAHEYYQIKAEINERGANLRATAWSALQSHTVIESTTVKYSKRREPLIFDKTEESLWFIPNNELEQLEEYKNLAVVLEEGPKQEDKIERFEFVTFHQSYGYEEFIEGLRPITNSEGDISYEVKPGVFKRICKRAESDPDKKYAIVIDEINRGNISKIFGELITLVEIDKRAGADNPLTLNLPYSGSQFSVPSNLDIIGTMNTADRSLTHIDVALRRRFNFQELRTDYSLITNNVDGINLRHMLYAINQRIELLLDRDHILGHALLMNVNSIVSLEHTFSTNIMPLLEEYFFENWDKINQVLNNNSFIEEQKNAHSIWLGNLDDYATKSYRINTKALSHNEAYKKIYADIDTSAFFECDQA